MCLSVAHYWAVGGCRLYQLTLLFVSRCLRLLIEDGVLHERERLGGVVSHFSDITNMRTFVDGLRKSVTDMARGKKPLQDEVQ